MKKISLLLVFSILISCFCGFTYVYAGENDYIIYAPTGGGEWAPSTYNENGFSFGNAYDYAMIYEPGVLITGRTIANFTVDIEKSGKYELYFTIAGVNVPYSASVGSNSVSNATLQCPAFDSFERIKMADVMISGGTNVFSIINEGTSADTLFIKSMELIYIGSELSVEAITAEATDVLQTEEIPSSCDALTVEFSEEVGSFEQVELMMDGVEIPLVASPDGKKLAISLKKSLISGKKCTLSLKNVYDKNSILSTEDTTIEFMVVDGTGTLSDLTVSEYSLTGEIFNVKGTVLSSKGIGIEGRKVSLFAGSNAVAEVLSGENGAFEISYTMPAGSNVGMKNFDVKTEYSQKSVSVSGLYAPEWAVTSFLETFSQKADAQSVMEYLSEASSEELLSIDVSEDILGISDTELVFSGLVGYSAQNIGDLRQKYYSRISMVRLTEADADGIEAYLSDSSIISSLGIDEKMLQDISENIEELAVQISEIENASDEQEYSKTVAGLVNQYALSKYGKSDISLAADNANTYIGRSVNIPIALMSAADEVKKINLKISADNDILSGAEFLSDGISDINISDGYAKIELVPQNLEASSLGTLKLISDNAGEYDLCISGNIVYEKNLEYELKSEILKKDIKVFVSSDVPPEVTTDYADSIEKAEEVETVLVGSGFAGIMDGAEYIRFPVTISESGKYEIYLTALSNSGSRVLVQTSLEQTEASDISQKAGDYSDAQAYESYLTRTEYLGAGTHYVRVKNVSGETAIKAVTLLKTEDKTAYRAYAPSSYNMTPAGVYVSGTYAAYYEDGTDMVGGTSVNFDVDVEEAGFYDIYVTAASVGGVDMVVSIGGERKFEQYLQTTEHTRLTKEHIGTIGIPAGKTTIAVTCSGTDADILMVNSIDAILKNTELTVDEIKAGDDLVLENSQVKISADSFEIKLSNEINTEGIENKVVLKENGVIVPAVVGASGDTVTLSLKKALAIGKTYEISLSGIYDSENTILMTPFDVQFTVGEAYENNASVLVTSSDMDGLILSVSGVALSSKGIGISGRKVCLYSEAGQLLSEVISAEDGEFELLYTLPENSQTGMHNFTVNCIYSESGVLVSEIYVTQTIENGIVQVLLGAQTASAVKAVLEQNETLLDINVTEDTRGIQNTDTVYLAIKGSAPETVKDIRNEYKKAIIMARANEAQNTDEIEALLNDAEVLEALSVNTSMLNDISDYRANLLGDIFDLPQLANTEEFTETVNTLVNKYALIKYSKSDAAIIADNVGAYIGKLVEIPVSADKDIEGAKEITLKITSSNNSLLSAATFSGEAVISEFSNGVLTVKINPVGNIKALGKLSFVSYNTVNESVLISGIVLYDEELDYELTSKLSEKSINVTITENSNNYGGGGSSGGGRGSGGIGGIITNTQETEFKFNDLGTVLWAEDAIEYLLAKGVVSESEDKAFRPNDFVTREEFVKMAVVALGVYDMNAKCEFLDVTPSAWYYPYVASAVENGLVSGYEGNFGAGNNIKREDIAVILSRILEKMGVVFEDNNQEVFSDDSEISPYAKAGVYSMRNLGIINGVGNQMFAPKDSATRAMSAKLIYEMMKAVGK